MDQLDALLLNHAKVKLLPRVGPAGPMLKRMATWSTRGFAGEAGPAHVDRIVKDMEAAGSPCCK
eukprot:7812614-Alexandrium_andersonii.AAC.1